MYAYVSIIIIKIFSLHGYIASVVAVPLLKADERKEQRRHVEAETRENNQMLHLFGVVKI